MTWLDSTGPLKRRLQRFFRVWAESECRRRDGYFNKYFVGPSTQMGNARRRMQRQLALRLAMAENPQSQRKTLP